MLGNCHLLSKGFVVGWSRVAQRGVAPLAIVPDLNEREDCSTHRSPCRPDLAVEQLDLKRGEEAFRDGKGVAVPDGTHRPHQASPLELLAEGQGGVLAAVIRVMDQPSRGVTVAESHRQGVEDQFRARWSAIA